MKISALIARLQEIQAECGDIPVELTEANFGEDVFYPVDEVIVNFDRQGCWIR